MADPISQEFVLGLGEGVGGIVRHPYVGAKTEGSLGAVKGVGRGLIGCLWHIFAGIRYSS